MLLGSYWCEELCCGCYECKFLVHCKSCFYRILTFLILPLMLDELLGGKVAYV